MIWLGNVAQNRDNNLNLIRAIAATAVLVSHAYPIALGPGTAEPLHGVTGYTLGTISVFAFFIISGFLIAQSWERTNNTRKFALARFLRLWPGLIVSILLVAFVLGPIVTSLPVATYLTHSETLSFVVRNIILLKVQFTLPGVYEELPYTAVEGSIWTLIYEVACYIGIFILGLAGLLKRPRVMAMIFILFMAAYWGVRWLDIDMHPRVENLRKFALPFGIGTAFYIWRAKLPLHLGAVIILAVLAWAVKGTDFYAPLFNLALGYGVFWIAYVPGGVLRAYNRLGDYSYGMYIYAFPIQGFAVWLWGPQDPLTNIALALPITLLLSVLSWHLVEKPALALRHRMA